MTAVASVLMGLGGTYTDLLGNQQNWLESKLSQPEDGWHYSCFFSVQAMFLWEFFCFCFCYMESTHSKHQVCYDCELFFFFRFYTILSNCAGS